MASVSKTASGTKTGNTVVLRKVKVFFQRFPGTNAASGIAGLNFTVTIGTAPPIAGVTPADGKVEIRLAAGDTAHLAILGSRYDVSLLVGGLHPVAQLRGVQQRLNMLGYNAGTLQGDNKRAVTAAPVTENQSTLETELAITNYQADNAPLFIDAIAGNQTQTNLKNKVQNNGGE